MPPHLLAKAVVLLSRKGQGHSSLCLVLFFLSWQISSFSSELFSPDSDSYGVLTSITMSWLRALSRQGAGAGRRCGVLALARVP